MSDDELISALEESRAMMIAVSTGGPRIGEVNSGFQESYLSVNGELARRGLVNPLPHGDLWKWYGRWSKGDLPSYQSRRCYFGDIFDPLIDRVRKADTRALEETGWGRVDRAVGKCRDQLAVANDEEDLQAIGLLRREALISLAQAVWSATRHPTLDGVVASETDGKRKLEAYIQVELAGGVKEQARKHARSALDLAVSLQHRRTVAFRDAALCVEATTSVVDAIAIVSGVRDSTTEANF